MNKIIWTICKQFIKQLHTMPDGIINPYTLEITTVPEKDVNPGL